SGVVVETASDRRIQAKPLGRNARRDGTVEDLAKLSDSGERPFMAVGQALELLEDLVVGAADRHHLENPPRLPLVRRSMSDDLGDDRIGVDLAELVERPQHGRRPVAQTETIEQAVEDLAMVDPD